MEPFWWQLGQAPIWSQEMANSGYLSAIARSLSWSHPLSLLGDSRARLLPDPEMSPSSRPPPLQHSPSPLIPLHPDHSCSHPLSPSVHSWNLFPFPARSGLPSFPPHHHPFLVPNLSGFVNCSIVSLYFTADIHSLIWVITYHVCLYRSGLPLSG